MKTELLYKALLKFTSGVVCVWVLLFLPAGTFHYWNAWLLMAILFIPMFVVGILLLFKNPGLLEKRLNAKEKQDEQSLVIRLSGLMFIVGFIIAGLNFRFAWLIMPDWIVWTGAVLFLLSYLLYGEVLRENTYLSMTIEVQEGQKVYRYRLVWHCQASYVQRDYSSVSVIITSTIAALYLMYIHDANGVQDGNYHHTYVREYRKPHIHYSEHSEDEAHSFYA